MKKIKAFQLDKKHVDYIESVRDELIKAETTVSRIKQSKEWKMAISYFNVLTCRGMLKTRPTKSNGYKFEVYDPDSMIVISKSDLAKICNQMQIDQIEQMKEV